MCGPIHLLAFHILFEEITSFPKEKGTIIQKLKQYSTLNEYSSVLMLFSPFLLNILLENFIHVCNVFWSYLPLFPLLFPSHPLWPFSFLQMPPHFCVFSVFVLWLIEFSQANFHEPSFGAFHWDMGDFLWATEDNQSFSPSTYQEVHRDG